MQWQRPSPDQLCCGPYRIHKSHVRGITQPAAAVYHVHAGTAFLGSCPNPDSAKALCETHHAQTRKPA